MLQPICHPLRWGTVKFVKKPTKVQWRNVSAFIRDSFAATAPVLSQDLVAELDAVVPIYSYPNFLRPPRLVGSAVLVCIRQRYFLFTAAHVLQEFNEQRIVTAAGGRLIQVTGESYRTKLPPSGTHRDDLVDAAVLSIQGEIPIELKELALPRSELFVGELADTDDYLVAGHPFKRSKVRDNFLEIDPLYFINVSANKLTYGHLGYSQASHCLVSCPQQWATHEGLIQPRSIPGMSGGGIWRLNPPKASKLEGTLAAILTDYLKPNNTMVGIRVRTHLNLIWAYNEDLRDALNLE